MIFPTHTHIEKAQTRYDWICSISDSIVFKNRIVRRPLDII